MSTVGTAQRVLLEDAAFTGTRSFKGLNMALGRTLVAVLIVNSFVGPSPKLTLSLYATLIDGSRFPTKLNKGGGEISSAPGLHVMVFGDTAESAELGNDRTIGKLPRHFEIELATTGSQTSADVKLESAYL